MRRSTFQVHHGDGRVETLDREALTRAIEAGRVAASARIALAGGRPKPILEHPAFARAFGEEPASRSRAARPPAAEAARPPAAEPQRRTSRSAPTTEELSRLRRPSSTREEPAEARPSRPPVASLKPLDLPLEPTPFDEATLAKGAEALLEHLCMLPLEAIVGCRVNAGRGALLRSAGGRARQIAEVASKTKAAGERMAYDEATRVVDRAVRAVSQPSTWRKYASASREAERYLSFDEFLDQGKRSNPPSGPARRVKPRAGAETASKPALSGESGGGAKASGEAGSRPAARKPKAARDAAPPKPSVSRPKASAKASRTARPDAAERLPGGSLLEASGVADMMRHMNEGYTIHAAKDDSVEASLQTPLSIYEPETKRPFYLPPPLEGGGSARANEGPLHWGVGEDSVAGKTVAPLAFVGLVLTALLMLFFPGAAAELSPEGVPTVALLRSALLAVCGLAGIVALRKEALSRVVGDADPEGVGVVFGLSLVMGLAAGTFLPLPVDASGGFGLVLALLLVRALGEWVFFDAYIARSLLCELKASVAAVLISGLVFGASMYTYAWQLNPETMSHLTLPLYTALIGLPAAFAVFRTRSALPALMLRVVVYALCAVFALL